MHIPIMNAEQTNESIDNGIQFVRRGKVFIAITAFCVRVGSMFKLFVCPKKAGAVDALEKSKLPTV